MPWIPTAASQGQRSGTSTSNGIQYNHSSKQAPPSQKKNKATTAAKHNHRNRDNVVQDDQENDNKPRLLKPLTAYNYYYRDERDNIVLGNSSDSSHDLPPPVHDFSERKRQKLLEDRWVRDPTKGKRKHRKTSHGKLEFTQ